MLCYITQKLQIWDQPTLKSHSRAKAERVYQYSSHKHHTLRAKLCAQMEDLITESEKIGRLLRGQS